MRRKQIPPSASKIFCTFLSPYNQHLTTSNIKTNLAPSSVLDLAGMDKIAMEVPGPIIDADEAKVDQNEKRLRLEITGEQLSHHNVESYIKSVHGAFASCFQSPMSRDLVRLLVLEQDSNYFDSMEEIAIFDGMNCNLFTLVQQVVVMKKRVHDLCAHYTKLDLAKNEANQLAETT
ncbi:hypothetical protein JCGZ_10576 [Jatropha curcas]|uniref:Uncharacterized protein n=1 Tax=Jatropha curcas TaxID=180498 RepID=A0A067KF12_JATCU|nr:hypothetical protein JCGZ_10576 [Jatropha curcas]